MSSFYVVEVDNDGFKVYNTGGNAIDPATESKLEAVRALLATIDADTSNLDVLLSTRATEATLEAARVLLSTIDADTSNLDVLLSTRATEATALLSDGRLTTIDSVLDSIKDTDGVKRITDALPVGANVIGKTHLTNGSIDATIETDVVDGKNRLSIDGKVAVVNLTPPPGTDPVQVAADTPLEVTTGISPHDTTYVISNLKTFTLQSIIAGSEGDSTENGSRVDIIYYDGTAEHLVARIYISGFSTAVSPDTSEARDGTAMVGNGTDKTIIVRRERLSGGSLEIDAVALGFEATT